MGKTIAEKIFAEHLVDTPFEDIQVLRLDGVFCHEITTPIAISDLAARGLDRVFDADKIKAVIDHVSPAKDSNTALQGKTLRDWAQRHSITDFFDIGANGVCHVLFPEMGFVLPGHTIIMGDSHTCTYGAFGAFAAGVGTTDLEVGLLKGVCAFQAPATIRVQISGDLADGVYAKDLILHIVGELGVNGATGRILEFTGDTVEHMSMEARMTLSNMVIEAGATCGICAPDMTTVDYLWEHISGEFGSREAAYRHFSRLHSDEDAVYQRTISVDATAIPPLTTFGYRPDQIRPVIDMSDTRIDQVYIGSCTNGRIEDLRAAATVLQGRKVHPQVRAIVSPASPTIFTRAMEEGILKVFMDAGFCVTNPSCGACLGMSNGVLAEGEVCASTTNRNFNGRMGKGGMVHLVSPATAAASAIAGYLTAQPTGGAIS